MIRRPVENLRQTTDAARSGQAYTGPKATLPAPFNNERATS